MTITNYLELNQLVEKFSDGFQVLGFPCPQFNNQEPGKNTEILDCLQYVRPGSGYVPLFPLMQKSIVNGEGTNDVFTWLKARCMGPQLEIGVPQFLQWEPVMANDITWNFEKFLIRKSGFVYKRYTPETNPLLLVNDIQDLLNE
eukprot:TRINITY_DN365_c0_g1_i1.p1 TRINITY_DN365_c0_g1~~TRINITY_DN365_c0_g1_i1.p1  ORF type:complete len:144 (+),score=29.82 TRINITY_DN365_c0_g1_i1:435-866(+)